MSLGVSLRELRAIAVIATAAVVVAAVGLEFVRSTTGQPVEIPLQATRDPVSYYFVTPSLGWAVENPTSTGRFAVFATTDGARHWRTQMLLESSVVGFVPAAAQFLDASHGYIAAGDPLQRLYRTTNGGRRWESAALPAGSARIDRIAFSSATSGWLLIRGRTTTLYSTRNAGDSWERLPDPPADADGLGVRGQTEAWMAAVGFGTPHVYMSADAGQTWQRKDLPALLGRSPQFGIPTGVDLLPQEGVRVFLPPTDQPRLVELGLSMSFTSLDHGATWRRVPPPPGSVAYQDALHWWAIGERSLFKSSDSGQTWTTVTDALPDWQYVPHVIDSKHAWAVTTVAGASGLALTDDGGLHWWRATVPPDA